MVELGLQDFGSEQRSLGATPSLCTCAQYMPGPLNRCDYCGKLLKPWTVPLTSKTARPGNRGRQVYSCRATPTCKYFRVIPVQSFALTNFPTPSFLTPSFPTPSSSSSSLSELSSMPSSRDKCMHLSCNKFSNRGCSKHLCRLHCIQAGGCAIAGHTSSSGPATATTTPINSPVVLPPLLSSAAHVVAGNTPSGSQTFLTHSPVTVSPPPPSFLPPNLPAAATSSLPPNLPAAATSSLPPNLPAAATSSLPPNLPAAATSSSQRLQPPRSPVTGPFLPVPHHTSTDEPSPSQSSAAGTPAIPPPPSRTRVVPRYASHMVSAFDAKFDEEQERSSRKRKREEQDAEQKLRERHQLTVHCWLKDGAPPTHDIFESSGKPPQFTFTKEHIEVLGLASTCDGTSTLVRFKVYQPDLRYWVRAGVGFTMPAATAQHIYVASLVVTDEQALESFIRDHTAKPVSHNMRTHLSAHRSSIRSQHNTGLVAAANVLKSPRRVCPRPIAPHPSLGPAAGPSRSQSQPHPSTDEDRFKKLHATGAIRSGKRKAIPCDPADFLELTSSSDESLPGSFHLPAGLRGETFTIDSSSESDAQAPSGGTRPDTVPAKSRDLRHLIPSLPDSDSLTSLDLSGADSNSDVDGKKIWPSGYSCVELHEGFSRVEMNMSRDGASMSWEDAVKEVFPDARRIKSATYYENRTRWLNASAHARKAALDAGKTSEGSWRMFTRKNPCAKAQVRNAKKKLTRHTAKKLEMVNEGDEESEV
ncbi:hypothetical protein BDY19DRAFT_998520 [Irpex rosettiformis]|uniref:Uncharacterized protein n=1 Tax=Irpex rosettiformis TaxID=378272 RepID=A0ACB8TNG2_9APHY|nr:hypothetical protein BDY19DRAFT_998520 [Irpex rosettiformis]